ncbi:hypothetical protein AUJ68_01310 [Candidatus Woesearchaeota archaeon CG1_02_57_44]|nr:MAG: hypothetical protein AUJ68_01310 [Candidatus Woesearchaeota archaeon CG1_02_57_44]
MADRHYHRYPTGERMDTNKPGSKDAEDVDQNNAPVNGMLEQITREQAAQAAALARQHGLVVGFTSGVFDILHRGHVHFLYDCKQHCDLLLVGVNTDSSVRRIKGASRPVQDERSRSLVVAALKPVDGVFLFSEENNNENITQLRPDVYLKAGDYAEAQLSSAPLVASYGGKTIIIPHRDNLSTTALLERAALLGRSATLTMKAGAKDARNNALFIDRDGTLIESIDHLHEPEKVTIRDGAKEALLSLQKDYRLVLVTNQMGIGIGHFTVEEYYSVTRQMLRLLDGVIFDKLYFCPHSLKEDCDCRKPKPGMLLRAADELGIDLASSWMIGDSTADISAGKAAGCRTIGLGIDGGDAIAASWKDVASLIASVGSPQGQQKDTTHHDTH